MESNKIKVIALGGLGEIGKNITAIEYNDEIMVIDCGIAFPDEEMYGVDLILPDISYLVENANRVKGIFLTHGHEDHIGGLPYILKQLNVPVYGTKLVTSIVGKKLEEHKILQECELHSVEPGESVSINDIKIEFIRITHSIADSCSLAIHTPIGIVFHTGDFKIDYTPIDGKKPDLERVAAIGREGVVLLLADSTNVYRKGHSMSESTIGDTFTRVFGRAKGRIIVATFASNIHRLQQIVNASEQYGRKIVFNGRSMELISEVAIELGYLHVNEGSLINIDDLEKYPSDKITIVTTGSQGEPMAALARIAFSSHRKIKIESDDMFIVSASPIPGNDKMISRVINQLVKKGADVIYEDLEGVHVSGHAYQEELKLIHTLIHPKYFMPVHGEYRHLKYHGDLAEKLGMDKSNIFVMETGQVLEVTEKEAKVEERVHTGNVFVDGLSVGDVGNIVLRDRRHLAQDGMVTIVVAIEMGSHTIISGPDVVTRGFVYVKESEELINEIRRIARTEIERCLEQYVSDRYALKSSVTHAIERFVYEKVKRKPSIIPIIMKV